MEHQQQQQQHQEMASGSPAEIKNDPGYVTHTFLIHFTPVDGID
jgi:hypothetical protein